MPPRRRGPARRRNRPADVFLNIPYDNKFQRLFLAYIAGVSAFGLIPRATLELRVSARRLDRILHLMQACTFAVDDLSRVELDRTPPGTPRFNMPFELGLSVALERFHQGPHAWFVFEAKDHRLTKSLSDLNGTDVYAHGGTVAGVFRELCNAFVRLSKQPSVPQMWHVYRDLRESLPAIVASSGARSTFEARVFRDLCVLASASADRHIV
jgi:hypothetical protein